MPRKSSPDASGVAVTVTPLQPPFTRDVMHFHFEGRRKILTVSLADGERIQALLQGRPEGRVVVLDPADNDRDIRVSVVQ